MTESPARPHALYRFFNAEDELLYVGITNNPSRRFTQHGVQREWWYEVATIRMEPHPDRDTVLAAEREAIKTEQPRYNVVHAGGPPVTTEQPAAVERPGGHPVAAGDCVALGLTPTPLGEQSCPVGVAVEVNPFGVRLALLRWFPGTFDGGETLVPWHRIMEIRWAPVMAEDHIEREGYVRSDDPDAPPMFDCDRLAYFQTSWTHGKERARADAQRDAARRNR